MKQLKASVGELTIGSPLILNDVLIKTGQPIFFLKLILVKYNSTYRSEKDSKKTKFMKYIIKFFPLDNSNIIN